MTGLPPSELTSTVDEWVVIYFPPEGDREKRFSGAQAEIRARRYAAREDIAQWNPLLDHRITTTTVVSELVRLDQ